MRRLLLLITFAVAACIGGRAATPDAGDVPDGSRDPAGSGSDMVAGRIEMTPSDRSLDLLVGVLAVSMIAPLGALRRRDARVHGGASPATA